MVLITHCTSPERLQEHYKNLHVKRSLLTDIYPLLIILSSLGKAQGGIVGRVLHLWAG